MSWPGRGAYGACILGGIIEDRGGHYAGAASDHGNLGPIYGRCSDSTIASGANHYIFDEIGSHGFSGHLFMGLGEWQSN